MHFEEIAVVNHGVDYIFYVIWQIRLRGDNCVECCVGTVWRVGAGLSRGIVKIVGWNEAEQLTQHGQALGIIVSEQMRDTRSFIVRNRAAKLFSGDDLVHDGSNYI